MAMFENFPYTNLHELNLDWIIKELKNMESTSVLSVNGETGYVTLYQNAKVEFPEITQNNWEIVRFANGTLCGIAFGNDGTAYFVKGNNYDQLYSQAHQPPYPVTSVNGMTGDITLYAEQYIRLPNLTDEDMHQWNIYRHINNITSGIQFTDDGKAYIMNGSNRYLIYTANDLPSFPVTSVNNQTGDVELYPNPDVVFPDLDSGYEWSIYREVNGINVGLVFENTGSASLLVGQNEYPLYIQGLNDPSDFDDPTSIILELKENLSAGTQWGIVRSIQNDDLVGIVFVYNSADQTYEGYLKVNNTLTKLLTLNDIPSTTGVISINGQTGVVTLTGEDIHITSQSNVTINSAISNLDTIIALLSSGIAKVINGDTCNLNLYENQYAFVINSTIQNISDGMYLVVNPVSANVPVGEADLNPITAGGLNVLRSEFHSENLSSCTAVHSHLNVKQNFIRKIGHTVYVSIAIDITDAITTSSHLMTVPVDYRPSTTITAMFALLNVNDTAIRANPNNIRIGADGYVFQNLTSTWSSGYIEALFVYRV